MDELESIIKEYREYKRMLEELEGITSALADEIKAAMVAAGKSKMVVGEYKLSYSDVKRETLDTALLEEVLGDLTKYKKVTTYKRFSVA